jgi:hypothetical protein
LIEWFDDFVLGMRFKSHDKKVTREDIKRFASEFDPQPYHMWIKLMMADDLAPSSSMRPLPSELH